MAKRNRVQFDRVPCCMFRLNLESSRHPSDHSIDIKVAACFLLFHATFGVTAVYASRRPNSCMLQNMARRNGANWPTVNDKQSGIPCQLDCVQNVTIPLMHWSVSGVVRAGSSGHASWICASGDLAQNSFLSHTVSVG